MYLSKKNSDSSISFSVRENYIKSQGDLKKSQYFIVILSHEQIPIYDIVTFLKSEKICYSPPYLKY
jgi:hypothetical protein